MIGNKTAIKHKPTIIIADDDPSVRLLLKYTLENDGYHALEAGNGNEALALFRNNDASMILLDAAMPEVDGFETCKQIKHDTPDIPVIMITSLDDDNSVEKAFECGANDYVTKPINWSILKHRIIRAKSYKTSNTLNSSGKLEEELDQHQYSISQRPRICIAEETPTAIICDYYHLGMQHKKLFSGRNHLSLKHTRQLFKESCDEYKMTNNKLRLVLKINPFTGNPLQYINMLHEVFDSSEIELSMLDCVFSELQLSTLESQRLYTALAELPVNLNIGNFSFSLHALNTIKSSRCNAIELDIPLIEKTLGQNEKQINKLLKKYQKYNLTLIAANVTSPEQLETSKKIQCTEAHGPAFTTFPL